MRSRISGSVNEPRIRSMNASSMLVWSMAKRSAYSTASRSCSRERALVRRPDRAVEVLAEPLRPDRVGPEGEADGAVVELGDPHPGRLAHPHGEDALVVGGVHEAGGRRTQLGLERPDLHGVTALAGRDLEAGHGPTLCQYSGLACSGSGRLSAPGERKVREWGSLATPSIRCARASG